MTQGWDLTEKVTENAHQFSRTYEDKAMPVLLWVDHFTKKAFIAVFQQLEQLEQRQIDIGILHEEAAYIVCTYTN